MAYGRTPWSEHHGGSVGAGLGGRLRSSEGEFLKVGRQGDANRLKELTSDAGGRGAQQEAFAILLKLDFLQPVEIAVDSGRCIFPVLPPSLCGIMWRGLVNQVPNSLNHIQPEMPVPRTRSRN